MSALCPQVSVIIPCYNYGRYLGDAINSVLQQNIEKGVEIIVVDDGSSDNTAEVAQGFGSRIRFIHQQNQGLSAARNAGMREAKGEFMVFLDADDLLGDGNLNAHLENFAASPDLDISVCHSIQISENGAKPTIWGLNASHLDMHLCHSNIAPVHTFMLRSQCAQDNFFDSSLAACEDYDYWLRCAAMGKRFASNPGTFVIYRLHENSMTTRNVRQMTNDSAVHSKIGEMLQTLPEFPRAGKFYGWLAYASGCLGKARGLYSGAPQYAIKLIEESAQALLRAAACAPKKMDEDPYLIHAANYYLASYLEYARALDLKPEGSTRKAMAFLAVKYPQLASLSPEALKARKHNLLMRIGCDTRPIEPAFKKISSL